MNGEQLLERAPLFTALSPKQIKSIAMSLLPQYTIALWVGAVSGGKTIASLFALLVAITKAPTGYPIVIIGRSIQTIERNVLIPLQNQELFGPLARLTVHRTGSSVAIILGRSVELIGASDAKAEGRIRGGTFGLVYVDEAVLLPEEFWKMLVTRLRAPGSRMLATTNPDSRNHWLRKQWILSKADHDMVVFHFTMHDNPLYYAGGKVGPEYIARMERAFAGVFYNRMILGRWTAAEGAIYDMWEPAKHVVRWEEMPPIDRIISVGIDVGVANASSAIMLGLTRERDRFGHPAPRLILMDEWRHDPNEEDAETKAKRGRLAPSLQAPHIRAWLQSLNHMPQGLEGFGNRVRPGTIYVDPAAQDMHEELKLLGVRPENADNAHAGISTMMSLLAGPRPRLIVTDRCRGFIGEVTEYIWDPKEQAKGIDEPIRKNDHSLDAARYAVRTSSMVWQHIFRQAYGLAA